MNYRIVLSVLFMMMFVFAASCFSMGSCPPEPEELNAFTSDKCTLFPSGSFEDKNLWCDCCFEHDIAYWKGGTIEEREAADAELRDCVAEKTGSDSLGEIMYIGVRAAASAAFPTWYRWGYGWPYGRGYLPSAPEEQEVAEQRLDEYYSSGEPYICDE